MKIQATGQYFDFEIIAKKIKREKAFLKFKKLLNYSSFKTFDFQWLRKNHLIIS